MRIFFPEQLSEKSSVTSRRSCAMLPWTSNRKWLPPLPPPHWKSPTNCLMDRSSPLVTRGSVAQRLSSSLPSWVWNLAVSMKLSTTPSWSATLTSVRTCTPTLSCPVVPQCTQVLLTECRRKSPPLRLQPSRSRSSLLLKGSTPYGSVDPSWLPCLPSNRCGSPSRNTTNQALALSTVNASKQFKLHLKLNCTNSNIYFYVMSRIIQWFICLWIEVIVPTPGMYIHYQVVSLLFII